MLEAMESILRPKRLTVMLADTKRSYENVVQSGSDNPQWSSARLRLGTQKDRLVAWGYEWEDASSQAGGIDGPLDRAGISDLVASIITSINNMLDEAERIQPRSSETTRRTEKTVQQGALDLERLEDITKTITMSIDTLCDLSHSQQIRHQDPSPQDAKHHSSSNSQSASGRINSPNLSLRPNVSYLDSDKIRMAQKDIPARGLPPSYESVAAGEDDKVWAYLDLEISPDMEVLAMPPPGGRQNVPVLFDYGYTCDTQSEAGQSWFLQRFHDLNHALKASPYISETSSEMMNLIGYFADPRRRRYASVYEIPRFTFSDPHTKDLNRIPHSLLSFLQNGADTDTSNMPSLEDRFRLAFNLASSLLHIHAKGVSHRNVSSSNIIFFTNAPTSQQPQRKIWKEGVIRERFIMSIDPQGSNAPISQEEPLSTSIYRHPRLEHFSNAPYKPAFDVYSLGLILLEIGLWMPLSKLWKPNYNRAHFKQKIQTAYANKLAGKCGTRYMRVVDYCLRIADRGGRQQHMPRSSEQTDWPPNFQPGFYWQAVKPLERCCSIDDMEDTYPAYGEPQPSLAATSSEPQTQNTTPREIPAETAPNPSNCDTPYGEKGDPKPQKQSNCKLKVWSHEIPPACTNYWNKTMLPKLEYIMKTIIDRKESCSVDLFMAGETAEAAKPTIYMTCASTQKARKALQHINRDQKMFDVRVVKGQITRSKAGRKKKGKKGQKLYSPATSKIAQAESETTTNPNLHYQQHPTCGASIGAYTDMEHLPPVSFGGTVSVDGKPYGMSVHHMLENEEEMDAGLDETIDLERSMAPGDRRVHFEESKTSHSWCPQDLPEALYPFEVSDDEDEGYQSSAADEDDDWLSDFAFQELESRIVHLDADDDVDMGDTLGIDPGSGERFLVTQPAIDDVPEGYFPVEEDKDEDHIASHSLGHIFASSGIKRARREGIAHEVDWALIRIKENRLGGCNFVAGGSLHCNTASSHSPPPSLKSSRQGKGKQPSSVSPSYPESVVPSEKLGGLRVHAIGRTSGLQSGVILPAMTMIKLPGRISFSHSWQVLGKFGGKSLSPPTSLPKSFKIAKKPIQKAVIPALGSSTTTPAASVHTSSHTLSAATPPTSPPWRSCSMTWRSDSARKSHCPPHPSHELPWQKRHLPTSMSLKRRTASCQPRTRHLTRLLAS